MARSRRQRQRQRRHHGGGYTFDGVATVTAGGVPLETRTAYDGCAPQPQRGGGCGCDGVMGPVGPQSGGGGGTGGYGFTLNNDIGKVYSSVNPGSCQGGGGGEGGAVTSMPAAYGFQSTGVVNTPSATYWDPSRVQRGGRRTRRGRRHSHRKMSRKSKR